MASVDLMASVAVKANDYIRVKVSNAVAGAEIVVVNYSRGHGPIHVDELWLLLQNNSTGTYLYNGGDYYSKLSEGGSTFRMGYERFTMTPGFVWTMQFNGDGTIFKASLDGTFYEKGSVERVLADRYQGLTYWDESLWVLIEDDDVYYIDQYPTSPNLPFLTYGQISSTTLAFPGAAFEHLVQARGSLWTVRETDLGGGVYEYDLVELSTAGSVLNEFSTPMIAGGSFLMSDQVGGMVIQDDDTLEWRRFDIPTETWSDIPSPIPADAPIGGLLSFRGAHYPVGNVGPNGQFAPDPFAESVVAGGPDTLNPDLIVSGGPDTLNPDVISGGTASRTTEF